MMIERHVSRIAALAVIALLICPSLMAQNRIRFRRGHSSATVSGRLARGGERSYVFRASRGQRVSFVISSRNGRVSFADNEATREFFRAEEDRDYEVSILNNGGPTRFTLTVTIR